MHPGSDCLDCHDGDEAPAFTVAGTVYGELHEDDDCFGVQGATVEITDANGDTFSLETNEAGNFYAEKSRGISFPVMASVSYDGSTVEMADPISEGGCAECHSQNGEEGALGRIVTPSGG